ncbi:thioredoxin family protein [Parapedobacter deserti]|uniref:Thioredoxin family protein n=1 Tax=Parapedobacter deserti TaxID=1912957 RepID=A0ABV7JTQ4_9SPHI
MSKTPNSEIIGARLLNDRQRDTLAITTVANGIFTLEAKQLALKEVYFLEIKGKSTRRGTSGLDWTEYVPVFFEKPGAALSLSQRSFDHPGSISKTEFSIAGDSDEQQLLNRWQHALNRRQADMEEKMVHYVLGMSGSEKVAAVAEKDTAVDVTHRFIQQRKPLVASLFLAYASNTHRKYVDDYAALYDTVSVAAKRTKYGIDLRQRLDRISAPVEQLKPTQLAAVDPGLQRLAWDDFDTCKYLLLSFWNSMDKRAHTVVKQVEDKASELAQRETAVIHLSMDSKLSQWKKMSQSLNLQHNYKLRNEAQQPLVDRLYMTELPRMVLIQPGGKVIDADVSLDGLVKRLERL